MIGRVVILYMLLIMLGCKKKQTIAEEQCECPIESNQSMIVSKDSSTQKEQIEIQPNVKLEAVIKKIITAEASTPSKYYYESNNLNAVYRIMVNEDGDVNQAANLYGNIACAFYKYICQDSAKSESEKKLSINQLLAEYKSNIYDLANILKSKKVTPKEANITSKDDQPHQVKRGDIPIQDKKEVIQNNVYGDNNYYEAISKPKFELKPVFETRFSESDSIYVSEYELFIDSKIPVTNLYLEASAKTIIDFEVGPYRSGVFMLGHSGKRESLIFTNIPNAIGKYHCIVKTKYKERPKISYDYE